MAIPGSSGLSTWTQESPEVAYSVLTLAALFVVWAILKALAWLADIWVSRQASYNIRMVQKYGQPNRRRFPSDARGRVFWLAQGRCEHWGPIFPFRCRRRANHADHWYAWSMGGKSTDRNAVALCEKHNMQKWAKIPTSVETSYIYIRRRLRIGVLAKVPGEWEYRRFGQKRIPTPTRLEPTELEDVVESPEEYPCEVESEDEPEEYDPTPEYGGYDSFVDGEPDNYPLVEPHRGYMGEPRI